MSYKIVLSVTERFEVYINGAFCCSVDTLKKAIGKIEKYRKGVM